MHARYLYRLGRIIRDVAWYESGSILPESEHAHDKLILVISTELLGEVLSN